MINEIELSDEQLAGVTGGSRTNTTTTSFSQFGANFANQATLINAPTTATATSSGKKSSSQALAAGATINAGNGFTGVNVNSIS